jgi:hypothetical protein
VVVVVEEEEGDEESRIRKADSAVLLLRGLRGSFSRTTASSSLPSSSGSSPSALSPAAAACPTIPLGLGPPRCRCFRLAT